MSRRTSWIVAGSIVVLATLSARAQMMPEFFEIWAAGNPVTNQNSLMTGAHSGLVGWKGAGAAGDVRDDQLAGMAMPAVRGGTRFIWAFGQCFGGGMFDELVALGGIQSGTSAARHNETSRYPKRPPNGVGHDWVTRYLMAMGGGAMARPTAASAAANDPFGTNPAAPRIMEVLGTEHPQYFSVGGGADNQVLHQAGGLAILWSGQPNLYDRNQIVWALNALVAMGYTRDRIFVFYGSGRLMGNHPIVQGHMINPNTGMPLNPSITLRAATFNALDTLFMAKFGPQVMCKPGSVFFLSNDHGFNTAINMGGAVPRPGDQGDPDTYEDMDAEDDYGDYGDGDSSQYPQMWMQLGACGCGPCEPPDAGSPPAPDAGSPPAPDAGSPPALDAGAYPLLW